ncbi:uncharacterized protein [Amphiura filiformis]|uniref:uncharacterized protein n=1 Tax=Amphiura filiformis TaxID=82378 RepID=UPI003B225ADE
MAWNTQICLRFEIIGCEEIIDNCGSQLGVEDSRIHSSQLEASSVFIASADQDARLNQLRVAGVSTGAWCAAVKDANQWIQVQLLAVTFVNGVMVQGMNATWMQWVTKFKVQYREYGDEWSYVRTHDNLDEMAFNGNTDENTVITRIFPAPVLANYIRILPLEWNNGVCLRFDIIGCKVPCPAQFEVDEPPDTSSCSACYIDQMCNEVRPGLPKALGMEDGSVAYNQITGSGHYYDRQPQYARLNGPSDWSAILQPYMWLQIDLLSELIVTGIQTQGSATTSFYVKTLEIERGFDASSLTPIKDTGSNTAKIFSANENNHGVVNIPFPKPVVARYVRIVVKSYNGYPRLRLEVIGYDCTCPYGLTDGYCAKEPGWQLVFKAVAGVTTSTVDDGTFDTYDPYQVWDRPEPFNEDNAEARQLNTNFKGHYKSSFALHWETRNIQKVKVALSDETANEVMALKFNGVGSNHLNWFSRNRLLSAPYADICTERQNIFSTSGHLSYGRQWFINNMYYGCPGASGWMVVTYKSHLGCDWEQQDAKPDFMYSKRGTYTNWNIDQPLGLADRRIEDSQITASSFWTSPNIRSPSEGRLNNDNYWVSASDDINEEHWLQVDFLTSVVIKGYKHRAMVNQINGLLVSQSLRVLMRIH